jgi:hypothetical protein
VNGGEQTLGCEPFARIDRRGRAKSLAFGWVVEQLSRDLR